MQATEDAIRSVVQEVLSQLNNRGGYGSASPAAHQNGDWGVFNCVDQAVAAATEGQKQLLNASLEDRAKALEIVRQICDTQADELGRLEL